MECAAGFHSHRVQLLASSRRLHSWNRLMRSPLNEIAALLGKCGKALTGAESEKIPVKLSPTYRLTLPKRYDTVTTSL